MATSGSWQVQYHFQGLEVRRFDSLIFITLFYLFLYNATFFNRREARPFEAVDIQDSNSPIVLNFTEVNRTEVASLLRPEGSNGSAGNELSILTSIAMLLALVVTQHLLSCKTQAPSLN